jgi:Tol biopolymer transport system component
MALTPGTRLGPYEILAPVGAGGMGEVYKARDTRLDRTVAIKISKEHFSERFEREARAVASLNHAHICTLHDVGPDYLVMEYIEGAPLRGPLPLDQALKYGAQICDALDAAHKKGITHRDLKPANILLTRSGIKLLDFGLAKIGVTAKPASEATLTMALTAKNEIVGTLYYMSPEQLHAQGTGREIDARSDIFSFGLVLYEMLTGKRAFEGSSPASVIAAIMERPAPSIADVAPPALDRVLRKCLAKDPDSRWQSVRDLKDELEWISAAPENGTAVPARSRLVRGLTGAAVVLALIAAGSLVFALRNRAAAVRKTAARFTISLPAGQEITSSPAITRDGRSIAYVAQQGTGDPQLYLRDLNSFEARPVAGSSGARGSFFSPDGKWVAFFAQRQLLKAEVAGGAPIRLAEAAYPWGGTWNDDNTIIYATSLGSGLGRISASGGTIESLTKPDGAAKGYAHVYPQALPGGRSVLFSVFGQAQGTAVLSLDSHRWEIVLPVQSFALGVFDPVSGSSGRLLVVDQAGGIRAAPFDAAHPAPTSVDRTVLTDVYYDVENESRGWLAVSDTRTAVYVPGSPAKTSLVWVDREGKVESLGKDQDAYREASLSPDGTKAAVRHGYEIWLHDLRRGTRSPLTSGTDSFLPIWSPDGKRIVFGSNRGGDWDIYSQPVDGSRPAEVMLKRPYDQFPQSIARDGTVLYMEIHPQTGRHLWTLSPDGKTTPLRVTPFNEAEGRFSPGASSGSATSPSWIAYTSDESGRREVYVESYPGGTNRTAVSNGGGSAPRWSPDGKELFYVTGDAVVAVAFRPDGSFGAPRRLFDRSNFYLDYRFEGYSVSSDGKRFLMIRRDVGSVPRQLNVILNWSDEGDPLAPAGNK